MATENRSDSQAHLQLKAVVTEVLSKTSEVGYIYLYSAFSKKMRESAEGKTELEQGLRLLAGVFSMGLQFGVGQEPFGPIMQDPQQGTRSIIPSDLTDQELNILESLLDASDHPAWIARICDVLWIRCKNHLHARKAIQAYVQCAEGTSTQWQQRAEYLRRAARLAMALGKNSPERSLVSDVVIKLFSEGKENCFCPERGHWPASLVKIVIESNLTKDWVTLAQHCEEIAHGFPISLGCEEPRTYYALAAKCYRRAGQEDKAKMAELAIAKHWEDEYEVIAKQGASGILQANRLEEAIKAYRSVGGQQDQVDRLIPLQKEANTLAFGQMKEVSLPVVDMSPIIKETRKAMEGRTGDAAIRGFINLHRPQLYQKILGDVKQSAKEHPLQAMLARTVLSPEGNQVAKVPGMLEDQDAAFSAAVVQQYNLGQMVVGGAVLEEARSILTKGSDGTWRESIKKIIAKCPFIPETRRAIYERGLIAGMEGDGITFVHVIIPQFEDLLRRLFHAHGLRTTFVDQEGVQEEYDLNKLLRDPNATVLLGEDLLWEMRSALIEKSGWNERNRTCHGLTEDSDFNPSSVNFLLWLVLFLITALHGPEDTSETPLSC